MACGCGNMRFMRIKEDQVAQIGEMWGRGANLGKHSFFMGIGRSSLMIEIFLEQLMQIFQSWWVGASDGRCVEGGQLCRYSSLLSLVFGEIPMLIFCF